MTDELTAWEAACAKVDEERHAAMGRFPRGAHLRSCLSNLYDTERRIIVDSLFPYPPKPEPPKEVEVGRSILRLRQTLEERLNSSTWTTWDWWTPERLYAVASLLPKDQRQRLAEAD